MEKGSTPASWHRLDAEAAPSAVLATALERLVEAGVSLGPA
jgi:hypothetical protein